MNTPVKAAVALAVLAAGWAGATALSGHKVQRALLEQAEAWQVDAPVRVKSVDYQKGFSSATRTMELEFGCAPQAGGSQAAPLRLRWRDQIQHGPLPGLSGLAAARIRSELLLDPSQAAALKQATGLDSLPLAVDTQVGFGGASDSRISMPKLALQPDANSRIALEGLELRLQLAADGSARYQGSLPGYRIEVPAQGFVMQMKDARFEGQGLAPLWWAASGKGGGSLGGLEMQARGADGQARTLFALKDLKYSQDGRLDAGKLYSAEMQFEGSGQAGDQAIEALRMKASLKNLDLQAYARVLGSFWQQGCQAQSLDPKAQAEAALQPLLALLPHNPSFSLDELSLKLAGQQAKLSYRIASQGVSAEDLKAPALAPVLMKKAQFSLGLELQQGFIEQVLAAAGKPMPVEVLQAQIDKGLAQGLLQRKGELLAAQFEFKGGQALLNGKAVPLPGAQPSVAAEQAPAPDDAE